MTQLIGEQIRDNTIHPKNLYQSIGVYNPLNSYVKGDSVIHSGSVWIAVADVEAANDKDDFSKAPGTDTRWVKINSVLFQFVDTVDDLRVLTVHTAGMQIGSFDLNAIWQFDDTSLDADDGINVIKPNDILDTDPGRWIRKDWYADRDKIQNTNGTSYAQIDNTTFNIKSNALNTNIIFKLTQGENYVPISIDANGTIYFKDPVSIATKYLNISPEGLYFYSWGNYGNYIQSYNQQLGDITTFRLPVSDGQTYFSFYTPTSDDTIIVRIYNNTNKLDITPKSISFYNTYTRFGINSNLSVYQKPVLFIGGDSGDTISEGTTIIIKGGDYFGTDVWQKGGDIKIDAGNRTTDDRHGDIYISYEGIGNIRIGDTTVPEEKLDILQTTKTQGRRIQLETITADTTLGKTNHYIIIDATNNDVTVTLPDTSSGTWHGQNYKLYRNDNSTFIVNINDSAGNTLFIMANGEKLNLIYDSTSNTWINW